MNKSNTKATKNPPNSIKNEDNDSMLGYLPEWIEDASIGDGTNDNSNYIYKKLPEKLIIEPNNSKREMDVYFSSAEHKDLQELLNYLLPKRREVSR